MKRKNHTGYITFVILSLIFFSCSGSKDNTNKQTVNSIQEEDKLIDYEKSFDPGRYDLVYEDYLPAVKKADSKNTKKNNQKKSVSGFRVQTTLSGEFEDCQRNRNELQKQFPDMKTYIVHEFPFYKLRIGDFPTRKEAEKFMKLLFEKDIKNGLIVPDKITIE
jgi:hypothetical protein